MLSSKNHQTPWVSMAKSPGPAEQPPQQSPTAVSRALPGRCLSSGSVRRDDRGAVRARRTGLSDHRRRNDHHTTQRRVLATACGAGVFIGHLVLEPVTELRGDRCRVPRLSHAHHLPTPLVAGRPVCRARHVGDGPAGSSPGDVAQQPQHPPGLPHRDSSVTTLTVGLVDGDLGRVGVRSRPLPARVPGTALHGEGGPECRPRRVGGSSRWGLGGSAVGRVCR